MRYDTEIETELARKRIASKVIPILRQLSPHAQNIFLASIERVAGDKYEEWANQTENITVKETLLKCAERERTVADKIEEFYCDATDLQKEVDGLKLNLDEITHDIYQGQSLRMQLAIQANGERNGAAHWLDAANQTEDDDLSEILEDCAELEMASAMDIERILKTEVL